MLAIDHETKRNVTKVCTFVAAGIANRYGLNVRRSNLGRSEIFSDPPRSAWRPEPASCTVGTWSLPRGKVAVGMALTAHPPTSAEVKEKVKLYLYLPSVPAAYVRGQPLPFVIYLCRIILTTVVFFPLQN